MSILVKDMQERAACHAIAQVVQKLQLHSEGNAVALQLFVSCCGNVLLVHVSLAAEQAEQELLNVLNGFSSNPDPPTHLPQQIAPT